MTIKGKIEKLTRKKPIVHYSEAIKRDKNYEC